MEPSAFIPTAEAGELWIVATANKGILLNNGDVSISPVPG